MSWLRCFPIEESTLFIQILLFVLYAQFTKSRTQSMSSVSLTNQLYGCLVVFNYDLLLEDSYKANETAIQKDGLTWWSHLVHCIRESFVIPNN